MEVITIDKAEQYKRPHRPLSQKSQGLTQLHEQGRVERIPVLPSIVLVSPEHFARSGRGVATCKAN